jgi:hypothetical protein
MADNLRYHPREAAKRDAVKDYAIRKWRKDVAAGREAAQAEAARRREAQWDIPSPGTPNAPGLPRDQFGRPHTFPKRLPSSEAIGAIIPRPRPAPQNGVGAAAIEGALRGGEVGRSQRVWEEEEPTPVPEEPPATPVGIDPVGQPSTPPWGRRTPPAERVRDLMKRRATRVGAAKKAKKGVGLSRAGQNFVDTVIGPAGILAREIMRPRDIMSEGMPGAGPVDPEDRIFPSTPTVPRVSARGIDPSYWR